MSKPLADKPAYRQFETEFDWGMALDSLGWSGQATVDLADTIIDRHVRGGKADSTAIVWVGKDGTERRIAFGELASESARFANLLLRLGVVKGDRVAIILPRIPEVIPVIVGAFRAGAIIVPIFTGFGPDAAAYRLSHSGAKVVCVDRRYRDLASSAGNLTVISVGGSEQRGDIDYHQALAAENVQCVSQRNARDEPAAIIYTSGSTGLPKGCVIAANILVAMWPYARYGLDLAETDVFWPTGDPSWGYGLCCYLPALALGMPVLCVEVNATPDVCQATILSVRRHQPGHNANGAEESDGARRNDTRFRIDGSCDIELRRAFERGSRRISFEVSGASLPMDHFGATEFGLPIGNHNGLRNAGEARLDGASGARTTHGGCQRGGRRTAAWNRVGLIAQRTDDGSRYWLRYWNDAAATQKLHRGDWICTGDLARRDEEGYFWFEGRSDDIIKSSGYRIGPFEIESAVLQHGFAAEVAVVGVPDAVKGQAVKAFVVTRPGIEPSLRLADEIIEFVKSRCGRHQSPREVQFVDSLPKTHSGKIQRFLLRQVAPRDKVSS